MSGTSQIENNDSAIQRQQMNAVAWMERGAIQERFPKLSFRPSAQKILVDKGRGGRAGVDIENVEINLFGLCVNFLIRIALHR